MTSIKYVVLCAPLLLGGCYGLVGNDEMDHYFERSNGITMSAGDAKQTDVAIHTITPWPSYVGDRRIAYDARRMGSAVTRYGDSTRPVDQLPDIGAATKAMGQAPPVTRNVNQTVNVNGLGAGAQGLAVPVGGNQ